VSGARVSSGGKKCMAQSGAHTGGVHGARFKDAALTKAGDQAFCPRHGLFVLAQNANSSKGIPKQPLMQITQAHIVESGEEL